METAFSRFFKRRHKYPKEYADRTQLPSFNGGSMEFKDKRNFMYAINKEAEAYQKDQGNTWHDGQLLQTEDKGIVKYYIGINKSGKVIGEWNNNRSVGLVFVIDFKHHN